MKSLANRLKALFRSANEYYLVSQWRCRATVDEVYEIVNTPSEFTFWWSDVVLKGERRDIVNGEQRIPSAVFMSKGFLPYTLTFQSYKTEDYAPYGYALRVMGDFEGTGRWRLEQLGPWVSVRFEWTVRVEKPLLRRLSWLLRPLFIANHRWSMRRGIRGLQRELERRRQSCPSLAAA